VSVEVSTTGNSIAWFELRREAIDWLSRRFARFGIESLAGMVVSDGSGKAVDAAMWLVDEMSPGRNPRPR
jgi:hypothetical protein